MKRLDLIDYWLKSSDEDYKTMKNLFESKDYSWSLFIGHLVIEKLIKALFIKMNDTNPPFTHDLNRLINKTDIVIENELADKLDMITKFNISARYPDYKMEFKEMCNKSFTKKQISDIEEIRLWLKELIKK